MPFFSISSNACLQTDTISELILDNCEDLLIEFILYFIGVRQFDKKIQVIDFTFWFMIHIPYIVCMGVGSFFAHQLGWRGR